MAGPATPPSRSTRCRIWASRTACIICLGLQRQRGRDDDLSGTQTARKIARVANAPSAFDEREFPDHPLYTGNPWFLPLIGGWYRMRDRLDRMLA